MHITSSVKQRSETLLGHSYEKVSKVDSRYLPTYLPMISMLKDSYERGDKSLIKRSKRLIEKKAAIICRRRTNRELGGGTDWCTERWTTKRRRKKDRQRQARTREGDGSIDGQVSWIPRHRERAVTVVVDVVTGFPKPDTFAKNIL